MWRLIFCFVFLLDALFSEKLRCGYVSCPANSGLLPCVSYLNVGLPGISVWALLGVLCVLIYGNTNIFHMSLYRCFVFVFSSGIIFLCLSQRRHDGEFSVFFSLVSCIFWFTLFVFELVPIKGHEIWDSLASWGILCLIVSYNVTFFSEAWKNVMNMGNDLFMCDLWCSTGSFILMWVSVKIFYGEELQRTFIY